LRRAKPIGTGAQLYIGGASETYRGGMGAFQEERQVLDRSTA
jgi:hypothetical protein